MAQCNPLCWQLPKILHQGTNLKSYYCGRWKKTRRYPEKEYQMHPELYFFHFSQQSAKSCDGLLAISLLSYSTLLCSCSFP